MPRHVDENILVQFYGIMTEMLVKTNPKIYRPCIEVSRNGDTTLYAKLKKVLYGYLRSELLLCRLLSGYLQEIGFLMTPLRYVCRKQGDRRVTMYCYLAIR